MVQAFSVFLDTFVICTCTALLILLSGFYTPGFEGDGIVLTQNSLAAVVGDWGRLFVSVALSLFVFTCILYNYYLGENSLQFLSRNRLVLLVFRALVLALVVWGSMQDLSTVFAFADITMTCLAFVNLVALALLFKVGLRVMRDYDEQRKAGIQQPVFDSSKFADLTWTVTPGLPIRRRKPPPTRQLAKFRRSADILLPGRPVRGRLLHLRSPLRMLSMRAVKNLLVLYTGGTIGMLETAEGLAPAGGFDARMREHLAQLTDAPQVQWTLQEMNPLLDSANMQQHNWLAMRDAIVAAVDAGHDGVLLLHGTDSLAYSAAALSFLLLGLPVPVLLTGSMLPAGAPGSDAWGNLCGALRLLEQGLEAGVQLYFHGQLLHGCRASKLRSEAFDAFAALPRHREGERAAELPAALSYRQQRQPVNLAVMPVFPACKPGT